MTDDRWYTVTAVVIVLVLVVSFLTGLALAGAFTPASAPAASGSLPTAHLYFTVTTSAATEYDTYYPSNLTITLGQPVEIIITCYDPGINNITAPYTNVIGTVGGMANFSWGFHDSEHVLDALPDGNISHTFTISVAGEAGTLLTDTGTPLVNVPVPVSPDGIVPATVSFSVLFTSAGQYEWRCYAPCDPYSMVTPGFMIGSISIG